MKNVFWISILVVFFSVLYACIEDDVQQISISAEKIDSVQMAESALLGTEIEVKMFYTRKNSCISYYGLNFEPNENNRLITLWTTDNSVSSATCEEVATVSSRTIEFSPVAAGTYTFQFWQGIDSTGENIFLTREIEVLAE